MGGVWDSNKGMTRRARIVVPEMPHHVTQRGNRGENVFFQKEDFRLYLDLLSEQCEKNGVDIWSYCLMTNHVHFIAVPRDTEGLGLAIGEAHRRYTKAINARMGWQGHLWQDRFFSCPMDEPHTLMAARYIENNPVAAGIVKTPESYLWSSARAHILGKEDGILKSAALLGMVNDWEAFVKSRPESAQIKTLESHIRNGRPLGSDAFLDTLEHVYGSTVRPRKRGPKSA